MFFVHIVFDLKSNNIYIYIINIYIYIMIIYIIKYSHVIILQERGGEDDDDLLSVDNGAF